MPYVQSKKVLKNILPGKLWQVSALTCTRRQEMVNMSRKNHGSTVLLRLDILGVQSLQGILELLTLVPVELSLTGLIIADKLWIVSFELVSIKISLKLFYVKILLNTK